MSYTRTAFILGKSAENPEEALRDLVQWLNAELSKIELQLKNPQVRGLSFETIYQVPDRYREGDMYYFDSTVPIQPPISGVYIRDANSWRRL